MNTPLHASGLRRLQLYLGLVKFPHTVFALPFGLMAVVVASDGLPSAAQLCWLLLAMVCARTAAMTFNRLVDRRLDAHNPRTSNRHLPVGSVSVGEARGLLVLACLGFLLAAFLLSWLCFVLAFPVLALLLGYSYTKRFTSASHFVLGLALGCAPMGVYVALTNTLPLEAVVLGLAVLCWVAGFDIIYALQDEGFDREYRLHSMVVRLGPARALLLSRGLHALTVALLFAYGALTPLGAWFMTGTLVVAAALMFEHRLVQPRDLSRVNVAFFTVNGLVGVVLFLFTAVDVWMQHTVH